MKSFLSPGIVLAASFFLLGSCIDIDARMSLDQEGAGTLELFYRISPRAADLERGDPGRDFLPLPMDEAAFRRRVGDRPGLELRSYSRSVERGAVHIRAILDFRDLSALNQLIGEGREVFSLKEEGETRIFSQSSGPGLAAETDPRARDFLAAYFGTHRLSFAFTAPASLKISEPASSRIGEKEARLSYPLSQLLLAEEPLVWRLSWVQGK